MNKVDMGLEFSSGKGGTQRAYQKQLQKELRENKLIDKLQEADVKQHKKKTIEKELAQFKDSVSIKSNQALSAGLKYEKIVPKKPENGPVETKDTSSKTIKDAMGALKMDAKQILSYLGHKIDFLGRIPELKEIFKHNTMQASSYNFFLAKFAQFKLGVVGQILSYIGVPVAELERLKKEALQEVFDENNLLMSENIYQSELIELTWGKSRKAKKSLESHTRIQNQILKTMANMGKQGYWTKSRILEEKLRQCEKIMAELQEEKAHLTYQLDYYLEKE